MNRQRTISVEILRDYETPEISIVPAVEALEEIQQIIPFDIIACNGLVRLTEQRLHGISITELPQVDFKATYGIILTGRPLVVPPEQILRPGNIVVGQTINQDNGKDYALMDFARATSPKYLTKHEIAHVFKVPREGESFDGIYHCTDKSCIMHVESSEQRREFCTNCIRQLKKAAVNLGYNAT